MAEASGLRTVLEMALDIAAPAPRVWAILTDFAAYPQWNPFLLSVEGRLRRGARLVARVAPPGQPAILVHLRLKRVRPPQELCWRGHVLAPGLLDGEQAFAITPLDDQHCRFHHVERLSGVLAPMLTAGVQLTTQAGVEAMGHALKARAEAPAGCDRT